VSTSRASLTFRSRVRDTSADIQHYVSCMISIISVRVEFALQYNAW